MASQEIAKIGEYTKSIIVDGNNSLHIEIDWEDKKTGSYQSELYIKLREKEYYIYLYQDAGRIDVVDFQVPEDWLSAIPSLSVAKGQLIINNYDGTSTEPIYTETKNFTVYVPEEFKPEISNLSVDILDMKSYVVDYALYGITFPRFKAIVTPHSTSPIKRCRVKGGGVDTLVDFQYYGEDFETSNFYAKGPAIVTWSTTKFTVTVEDERGRTAEITSDDFYIQSYNRPSINSLSAYRTDENGIAQADGDYIKATVDASISPIKDSNEENINTVDYYLSWEDVNGNGIHGYEPDGEKNTVIFEADKDLGFEIKCVVSDKYMQTTAYCTVHGDKKDFNIADGGGGAAIGTKATKGYFDVAHESRFHKGVNAKEEISSEKGLISSGTGSKGDFLSFGGAERLITYKTPGGATYYADFDECTNLGVYGVYYDNDTKGYDWEKIMNMPCAKAGTLRVFNATGNMDEWATEQYLMQEYVVCDGSAIYRRVLSKVRADEDTEWPVNWTFGKWYCYLGTIDNIIESGTVDGWNYRMWSSGVTECWAKVSVTTKLDTSIADSNFYRSDVLSKNFPSKFFTQIDAANVEMVRNADAIYIARISSVTTGTIQYYAYREGKAITSGIACGFYITVKGRWK